MGNEYNVETEEVQEEITEEGAPDPRYKLSMTMLRDERNRLLRDTDHWGYEDTAPMTQEEKDYRQALRDITKTYDHINKVVWPTKPDRS